MYLRRAPEKYIAGAALDRAGLGGKGQVIMVITPLCLPFQS
jgi:hypothetical protein